jgi:hypothetical protein
MKGHRQTVVGLGKNISGGTRTTLSRAAARL